MSKLHSKFWVALSGEYGIGVETFNTDNWSEKDFALIEWAHDSERLELARAIDAKRKKQWQRTQRIISAAEAMEVRHFFIDENGVVELDPDTGEAI